jgi:hypothetical protein
MKNNRDNAGAPATRPAMGHIRHKRRHIWRGLGIFVLVLAVLLVIGRLLLPGFLQDYVNRTLDYSPLYDGSIGQVRVHLWRGAYSIEDVRINKTTGDVPVPFFAAKRVDFALEWKALRHRRLVGRVLMEQPEINLVDAPSDEGDQTGSGGPWLEMIRDLFPFKINSAIIKNGSIHFRAYQLAKPVDVYISEV